MQAAQEGIVTKEDCTWVKRSTVWEGTFEHDGKDITCSHRNKQGAVSAINARLARLNVVAQSN